MIEHIKDNWTRLDTLEKVFAAIGFTFLLPVIIPIVIIHFGMWLLLNGVDE